MVPSPSGGKSAQGAWMSVPLEVGDIDEGEVRCGRPCSAGGGKSALGGARWVGVASADEDEEALDDVDECKKAAADVGDNSDIDVP